MAGACQCSCGKPSIGAEICEHAVAHIKAAGLNVQDFIPVPNWFAQYKVLRIKRARFFDLYHGQKEGPHSSFARSKLKPLMVDVRDTDLKHYPNNAHQFEC